MSPERERRACVATSVMPCAGERHARVATTLIFFLTGWGYAAWATRIPSIKEQLGLSPGALALGIAGLEAGAIAGLPLGGALVTRIASRGALRIGFSTFPAALVLVSVAPSPAALAAALALMAAATSVVDVAMNTQGVELERRYERPILASLHAAHPFGLVAGGLAGTAAAAAGVPVEAHFAAAAGLALLAALGATAWLVREPERAGRRAFVRPNRRLLLLGLIAFCAFLLDGAAYNWSAVHMRGEHGTGPGLAATAFTLFASALAVGRLFGDRLVGRCGRMRAVQGCGAVAAAGATIAVAGPSAALCLAGWALFGLGLAALAPTVLGAAPGARADVPPAVAIAAVTTIGYLGSFSGPPLIGALAELTGLTAALGVLVAVSGALVLLAPAALPRRAERSRLSRPA